MDEIRSIRFEHRPSGAQFAAVRVRCGPIQLPLHVHSNHSVTVFDDAHEFRTRSRTRIAPPGSVAVAQAGEPHANLPLAGRGLRFSALEFEPEAWSSVFGCGVAPGLGTGVLHDAHLGQMLRGLCREALQPGDPELRDALLERFLTTLRRRVDAKREQRAAPDRPHHALSRACRDFLFAHASERVTLSDLAQRAGFNPDYLARRFRRDFGMTAHQYLLSARLDLARKLLRTGCSGACAAWPSSREIPSCATRCSNAS